MSETSLSLLDRARGDANDESWRHLASAYSPLLRAWLLRFEVAATDADDLVQEVLMAVLRELPRFQHSGRAGAFRSWLRTILVHRLRDFWRSRNYRPAAAGGSTWMEKVQQLEDESSDVSRECGRLSPGFFNEFHVENHNPPGPFETKPGETYKISFWAKNAGSEFVFKARGVSALGGDPGTVIKSKETFNEWRRFECTYTIPPKMWLRLELIVVQPGTFWIDDLQIVKVNDTAR